MSAIQPLRPAASDEQAFESLFHAHYASLCSFVLSYVRAPDVAEEVVQTVFLRIWERRGTWPPAEEMRAYLFAACRNQAIGILKHDRVVAHTAARVTRERLLIGTGDGPPSPDAELRASEIGVALRAAIQALPERRRMVVVLRWEHQMSYTEIATVLAISPKTAEVQMSRALASLRKQLAYLRE